ncbi:MAG: cupin domain-containing protein, partial [Candidatus Pacebacteria bacterium]|nr:cupin domain-containing protein [Candidatus Paceibacterota bacterium]
KYLFDALNNALPLIKEGAICIFGIKPNSPNTGYGYITKGELISNNIYYPSSFVEKPQLEKAVSLIQCGALWNSGLYFCIPESLEEEAFKYEKTIQTTIQKYFSTLTEDKHGFYTISIECYNSLPSVSIDNGITEKTNKIILAETPITWSDLGSWRSLHTHFDKDKDNNVIRGDTLTFNTKNSYLESTSRLVTVLGLDNVGVVETPDAILVFSLQESEGIKKIVNNLTEDKRSEIDTHTKVERPWGDYQILGNESHYQSKKITVLPGAELSLQRHKRRAEHWIVVQGIATVTRDKDVFNLKKNESTFLPIGAMHRLQNNHTEDLHLIEIQTGDYFGEDDIERFEDTYGRS